MSLIHQALKKLEGARKGRPSAEPRPAPGKAGPGGRKVNTVLIVVFIAAVGAGLAAYSYLGHLQKTDIRTEAAQGQTATQRAPAPTGQGGAKAPPEAGPETHNEKTGTGTYGRVERGMIFFNAGDYPRAAGEFRAAVESEPANPVYRNNLGLALFRSGDDTGAEEAFREALGLRPGYPEGLNNYAVLLASRGERDRALEMFERAVKADPGYADAYLNRAVVLEKAGMTEDAVEAYRDYLRAAGDGETKTRVRRRIAELRAGMIMEKTIK